MDDLAPSGTIARIRANLAALQLLRQLQAGGQPAGTSEQTILARWSGWGACAEVFDRRRNDFEWARTEMARWMSADELAAAELTTVNAHYTDPQVALAMWDVLARLGFTGGRVLEPGCGSGTFIGTAPATADMTGVELDPVTAQIASHLYPSAKVRCESFADSPHPAGYFDAVIGNVPFGQITLHDPVHNKPGLSMHNHFIVKALHLVKPGGLVAVLTSRYTLDAADQNARYEIGALGDLAVAVRLPSRSHQRAAGTSAVMDLLVFRRREYGRRPPRADWMNVQTVYVPTDPDRPYGPTTGVTVNRALHNGPGVILGDLASGGMYRADDLTVTARPGPLPVQLADALADQADLAAEQNLTASPDPAASPKDPVIPDPGADVSALPEGHLSWHPAEGVFSTARGGLLFPHKVPVTQQDELRALLALRDTTAALLTTESGSAVDTPQMASLRADLNGQYAAYAARWGCLNRFTRRRTGRTDPESGLPLLAQIRPPQGGFRTDPAAMLVFSLEKFDPVEQTADLADIFTRRVVAPREARSTAESPTDALAICLDTYGRVDLTEVGRLLGCEPPAARVQLGDLVFDIPPTDEGSAEVVTRAEYLSGDVRAKLAAAEAAARADARYWVNVNELRKVIPTDLTPGQITARLGAVWIPKEVVAEFLTGLLEDPRLKIEHPGGQIWTIVPGPGKKDSVLATSTWGTHRADAYRLVSSVMEQRKVEVRDTLKTHTGTVSVLNPDETLAAVEKAAAISEQFSEWVWSDPARAATLAALYNERFNGTVLRSYDGTHLTLPGLAVGFVPHSHQRTAVARIIHEPTVLLAHEVGAGKTAEMIIGCMELRRLGMVTKPMVVVPNHMLEQFTREWLQLYPQAKVLIAYREEMQGPRRRLFVARCATGDWDAVVISRSGFERIPLSMREQQKYINAEIDQIDEWIQASDAGDRLSVKRLAAAKLRIQQHLKALLDKPSDPGVTFEQLGVDHVTVDEAHGYKNLRTPSNIADAAIDGSRRATDLHMKLEWLRARNGSRIAVFATATPIANSITEAHVMIRYLRPDLLVKLDMLVFDSWAATFGLVETGIELAPEGGSSFRLKSRFRKFVNVPELMITFHLFADVKLAADLDLTVPLIFPRTTDGAREPEIVTCDPTAALEAYVADLGQRAEKIRNRQVRPEEDNMLKVSSDGRGAALDLRLVGMPQDTPGKIAKVAGKIWQVEEAHPGNLQIVFCDLGTPRDEWNAYDELRDLLIASGMPAKRIRFIHSAKNDRDKAQLFAACRSGHVSVLMGSTEKMGVGTNVQDVAIALHQVDAPWKPAEVTQRDGRIIRQGNTHGQVYLFRYVTLRSFDAYMWQTLARKAAFIAQLMRPGGLDVREVEDIGDMALSFNEIRAVATDNPLLLDRAEAEAAMVLLERAERAHHRDQATLRFTVSQAETTIEVKQQLIMAADAARTVRDKANAAGFSATIAGQEYDSAEDAGKALQEHLMESFDELRDAMAMDGLKLADRTVTVGWLAGFELTAYLFRNVGKSTRADLRLTGAPGAAIRFNRGEIRDMAPARVVELTAATLDTLEQTIADAAGQITRSQEWLQEARPRLGLQFGKYDELEEARTRLASIDGQIEEMASKTQEAESDSHKQAKAVDLEARRAATAIAAAAPAN